MQLPAVVKLSAVGAFMLEHVMCPHSGNSEANIVVLWCCTKSQGWAIHS